MSEEQKAKMQQKALEARQKKEAEAKAHAEAVKAELSQQNPTISDEQLEKKVKFTLEGEKLDSDIALSQKRTEDLIIKRFKRNNPSSTGISADKIRRLLE